MWLIVKQILHSLHRALCEVMVVYSAQSKTKMVEEVWFGKGPVIYYRRGQGIWYKTGEVGR